MLRSKVQWAEEGEKSSAFFLNLENHNHENKTILQLKDANDNLITNQNEILEKLYDFYENLYTEPNIANRHKNKRNLF